MTDRWAQLDHAEGGTHHSKATANATSVNPKAHDNPATLPEGDSHNAGGIAAALARRSRINAAKAVLKKAFLFPEEGLGPMSYQILAWYGPPTSIYRGVIHGVPYESLHFETAPNVKRATVKVTGYDE